jgi:hypothetical protein
MTTFRVAICTKPLAGQQKEIKLCGSTITLGKDLCQIGSNQHIEHGQRKQPPIHGAGAWRIHNGSRVFGVATIVKVLANVNAGGVGQGARIFGPIVVVIKGSRDKGRLLRRHLGDKTPIGAGRFWEGFEGKGFGRQRSFCGGEFLIGHGGVANKISPNREEMKVTRNSKHEDETGHALPPPNNVASTEDLAVLNLHTLCIRLLPGSLILIEDRNVALVIFSRSAAVVTCVVHVGVLPKQAPRVPNIAGRSRP